MNKNDKNTPKRRFKEFKNAVAWEQRKLGEILQEQVNRTSDFNSNPLFSLTIEKGITPKTDRYERGFLVQKEEELFKVVRPEEFVTNPMNLRFGALGYNKNPYNISVSGYYDVFSIDENQCSSFWSAYFKTPVAMWKFDNAATGSLIEKRRVKYSTLTELKFPMPVSMKEKIKIGSYFASIDQLITLHQRKLEKIKETKKAYLTEMFPAEGERKPKRRFAGFTDDWEQRKLSEIYQTIGNAFVGTATPYYVENGHFYLESNNVKDGSINHNLEIFINDEFYQKQKDKWLHTGDMVMVQSGHVGHAAVIPEELDNTAAHALIMFKNPKTEIEPYFLNYEYQTARSKKQIENITVGNTIKHILASEMQNYIVDVTSLKEQRVIASYFRNLDNLITLHQRKIEKLQNIKKAYLNEMFV